MARIMLALCVLLPALTTPAGAGEGTYLHVSDVHLDLSGKSSDTDPQLWAITKGKLESVLSGPDAPAFVIYRYGNRLFSTGAYVFYQCS